MNMKSLKQIVDYLILNSSGMSDLGLYHGKVGVAIFFAHYSRYLKNDLYADFSYYLIKESYDELFSYLLNIEYGLSGIGWGINYLVNNNYLSGNIDDVLYDIDSCILKCDLNKIDDFTFDRGFGGILCYICSRLFYKSDKCLFDSKYLNDIKEILILNNNVCLDSNSKIIFNMFLNDNFDIKIDKLIFDIIKNRNNCCKCSFDSLGLLDGLSGLAYIYLDNMMNDETCLCIR
ncbi:lanthionine synthetase LanC family protein [Parabacteroides hominis]|uniref:Lanthionine synthetase C-like protein n=1 Tax=Parabacteroides hominis TaxID=2763057 RepID=A0ABR7DNA9_9BACT|nr:lanthionine synthetase LanC family protein [Parabacteroides hominis]MBC5632929.1 hypothetical protein [Parabacteroides hominis]